MPKVNQATDLKALAEDLKSGGKSDGQRRTNPEAYVNIRVPDKHGNLHNVSGYFVIESKTAVNRNLIEKAKASKDGHFELKGAVVEIRQVVKDDGETVIEF